MVKANCKPLDSDDSTKGLKDRTCVHEVGWERVLGGTTLGLAVENHA